MAGVNLSGILYIYEARLEARAVLVQEALCDSRYRDRRSAAICITDFERKPFSFHRTAQWSACRQRAGSA